MYFAGGTLRYFRKEIVVQTFYQQGRLELEGRVMLKELQFFRQLDMIATTTATIFYRMFFNDLIIKQDLPQLLYRKKLCAHECQKKYANNLFHPIITKIS
jgi:hypothetical protein